MVVFLSMYQLKNMAFHSYTALITLLVTSAKNYKTPLSVWIQS